MATERNTVRTPRGKLTSQLTDTEIKRAKPNGKTQLKPDGAGLYLRIGPGGSKTFLYRYAVGTKDHWMTLGSYPETSLAEVRNRAAAQRSLRSQNLDPLAERQRVAEEREVSERQRKADAALGAARVRTFEQCAEQYIVAHQKTWTNDRFRRYWEQSLVTYAYPAIGHLPVADIDRGLVKQVLAPIWNTKTKSAKDLRGRISKILGWAIAEGWREGPNPAAWQENLEHSFPRPSTVAPVKPFEALRYKDVPAFMARLRKDDRIAARALEFLILCASRTGEVRFAKWSEIDWDERTWTIPKARMKMRRNAWAEDHIVPLSDRAMAILTALKGDGEPDPNAYIFAASDASHAPGAQIMLRVLQKIWPENPDLSVHGFRSCFADWAGDCTDASEESIEFSLAHTKKGVAGRYRRQTAIEKRRMLLAQWSSYCAAATVVPFKRRA